jgi:hypothetical protein
MSHLTGWLSSKQWHIQHGGVKVKSVNVRMAPEFTSLHSTPAFSPAAAFRPAAAAHRVKKTVFRST